MDIRKILLSKTFVLLFITVILINFLLLGIILQNGLTSEDWWILFDYKTIPSGTLLNQYLVALKTGGLHHAYQMIYVGTLEAFFKGYYPGYQVATIIFKILATISLYPVILMIFKRKLLAVLTTTLYALSFSSTGAFMFVCIGSDYLAIFMMNLFFLSYFLYFKSYQKQLLFLSTIFLFLSFMFSPIRLYPLLGIVVLIEGFILLKNRNKEILISGAKRLVILFIPFFILWLITKSTTQNHLSTPLVIYQLLSYGNFQLLLPPFAGIGYTILTNDQWFIFGTLNLDNLKDYLFFLIKGPIPIYTTLAILISLLTPKKRLIFSLVIISVNIIFQIVCYFMITNTRGMTGSNIKGFYPVTTPAIFLGFFVTSIGLISFWLWLKSKKPNPLFLALSMGVFISSAFLWGTWLIKGDVLTFKEGIHWYLPASAIGTSLIIGGLMVLTFDRIKLLKKASKYFFIMVLFSLLIPIYFISSKEINKTYQEFLDTGYKAVDQDVMMVKLRSYIKGPLDKSPVFFYFEADGQTFFPVSLLYGFNERMLIKDWKLINGCVAYLYSKENLEKSVTTQDGMKGFKVSSLCIENQKFVKRPEMFYKVENFHALKLQGKEVIDIKDRVLKELDFQ